MCVRGCGREDTDAHVRPRLVKVGGNKSREGLEGTGRDKVYGEDVFVLVQFTEKEGEGGLVPMGGGKNGLLGGFGGT